MNAAMPTYEQLLGWICELDPPETSAQRNIRWVTDKRVVGVSKTYQNRIELFLAGSEIKPVSRTLRDSIEYQPWWHQDSQQASFAANRLLLPTPGHFNQVAAFLCIELLRSGAESDLRTAFRKSEPVLELAIERLRLSGSAFLGLAGELLLLSALCQQVPDSKVASIISGWAGWQHSVRDFVIGSIGIEVKTTTGLTSTHQIQGTHQVELSDTSANGVKEAELYLVSIGLQETTPHGNSFSVPSLTKRIVSELAASGRPDVTDTFLSRLREYGSDSGFGYDHHTMSGDPAFAQSFAVRFVHCYNMTDPNVSVLRRPDVVMHQHVDARSLSYRIDLPEKVSGDLNPILGLNQAAQTILDGL